MTMDVCGQSIARSCPSRRPDLSTGRTRTVLIPDADVRRAHEVICDLIEWNRECRSQGRVYAFGNMLSVLDSIDALVMMFQARDRISPTCA